MSEIYLDDIPTPKEMGSSYFFKSNIDAFDSYVNMRIEGAASFVALRRSFGEDYADSYTMARIYAVESTEYFIAEFRARLLATPINVLWNDKKAVHALLSLASNPTVKDATQLGAIKELNILVGITIVDESGKTKRGRTLDDFYTDSAPTPPQASVSAENTQPTAQGAAE